MRRSQCYRLCATSSYSTGHHACYSRVRACLEQASRWHHEHCRTRLRQLHEQHQVVVLELATRLVCLCAGYRDPRSDPWPLLVNVRCLKIPETLPVNLRPLLGEWLRSKGRLAQVSCVSFRPWMRGSVAIELEPVRAGEPERMSPEERFTLLSLDTRDGLLETVLMRVNPLFASSGRPRRRG